MSKKVLLNMEKQTFTGNVLDVGFNNYGVIYNLYNSDGEVEYFSGKKDKKFIKKGLYDSCVLFFTLSSVWLHISRSSLLKELCSYLKEDGVIYIWDMDKGYSHTFDCKLEVMLSKENIKLIMLKDYNIFKDVSRKTTIKLVEKYFEVIDLESTDNIYCIKGIKKRGNYNESSTSRSKFKIHT